MPEDEGLSLEEIQAFFSGNSGSQFKSKTEAFMEAEEKLHPDHSNKNCSEYKTRKNQPRQNRQ